MDESFNPYFHWLGLPETLQRPDHYALLGLDRFESDLQVIKTAADRAATRVRSFRPGDKARSWAALLDELDEARRSLTDATAKEKYDAQLRDPAATDTAAAGVPAEGASADGAGENATTAKGAPQAAGSTSAPINPAMYPPGLGPAPQPDQPRYGPAGPAPDSVTEQAPASPAPVGDPSMFAPGYAPQDASANANEDTPTPHTSHSSHSSTGEAGYFPSSTPGRVPMGRGDSPAATGPAVSSGDPMAPMAEVYDAEIYEGDPMAPMANPHTRADAVPAGSGSNLAAHDPMAPMAMPVYDASVYEASVYDPSQTSTPNAAGAASNAPIPVGGRLDDESPAAEIKADKRPMARRSGTGVKLLAAGVGAVAAMAIGVAGLFLFWPDENQPGLQSVAYTGEDVDPPVIDKSDPNPPPDEPEDQPEPEDDGGNPIVRPPQPEPDPNPNVEPAPEPEPEPPLPEPEPPITIPIPQPEPEPEPVPLTPAEKDELRIALLSARSAMGDRDQAAVERHLATATALARGDEHKALVRRLGELNHYVKEFWRSVDEAYNNLQPSTTIKVGNGEVAIVEVDAQKLIVRSFGSNRRIPRDDLPSGLAMAIANNWFTDEPVNKVVKGALLFVDPNGRPEETRQLWQEAQAAGVDIATLMPVLDDNYDF